MEGFKAAFINEIEKMYKRKKALVIVIISLAVIVFGQLIITGVRNGLGLRGVSSMEFPLLVLYVFANTVLPLFTALMAIDTFSGEFSQNTMKIALIRPVTRLKLFSSKIAATAFFVLANLLAVMILSTLTGLLFNTSSISAAGFVKIIASYLITMAPIMVIALIVVFLSNLFKSGTAVFFLSIILFIACKALGFVFSQYSSLFITSMLDWYSYWISAAMPLMKITRQFFIMASYGIMFFTAGYYLFDKKDL